MPFSVFTSLISPKVGVTFYFFLQQKLVLSDLVLKLGCLNEKPEWDMNYCAELRDIFTHISFQFCP